MYTWLVLDYSLSWGWALSFDFKGLFDYDIIHTDDIEKALAAFRKPYVRFVNRQESNALWDEICLGEQLARNELDARHWAFITFRDSGLLPEWQFRGEQEERLHSAYMEAEWDWWETEGFY